ncbi:testis-specific serine/threonine-protein kinase 1-like [Centruroides sculpturatus]|uniref:testis-specific serine/threonine-protein kinase 1-like n=1 Tax=Centruroides sculpturatus TaxID=218467 RepID=UPI000C6DE6FD|nr:testis-specific serine/threonine-protein kinase 1-like [Centruroides sculpturatus]
MSSSRRSADSITPTDFLKKYGYKMGSVIGEGSYSKVRIAQRKGKYLAIKIISRYGNSSEYIQRFLPRELGIISEIAHPHIIEINRIIDFGPEVYIFMELAENGDLLDYMKRHLIISEERAQKYFFHLTLAVDYLHSNNISHRDIKCENLLIMADDTIKLTDFGFSRKYDSKAGKKHLSETYCGSAAYAAPEVLQGVPYNPMMNDVWSMGCILFIMITGTMPFDDSNPRKMIQNQKAKRYQNPMVYNKNLSSDCITLINQTLEPDAKKRITAQEILNGRWLYQLQNCLNEK